MGGFSNPGERESWVFHRVAFIHSYDTYLFILFARYCTRFWVLVNKNYPLPPKKLGYCFSLLWLMRLFCLLISSASAISRETLIIVTSDDSNNLHQVYVFSFCLPQVLTVALSYCYVTPIGWFHSQVPCHCCHVRLYSHPHVPGWGRLRNGCWLKIISSIAVFLLLSLVLCPPLWFVLFISLTFFY